MAALVLNLVGSDMEVFLAKKEDGSPVPVCGRIGGTKQEPLPVLGGNGFAVQEDNVMLEFNIPPAADVTSFVTSFSDILKYIEDLVAKQDLVIDISASKRFADEDLQSPQAKHIGCEPDMNAHTGEIRQMSIRDMPNLRCAGGHIHLGLNLEGEPDKVPNLTNLMSVVKYLDIFMGIPSMFFDNDLSRRRLYGQPGIFRKKNYGLEYRALSNAWIKTPERISWAFLAAHRAVKAHNEGMAANFLDVENVIKNYDLHRASRYMEYWDLSLPQGESRAFCAA